MKHMKQRRKSQISIYILILGLLVCFIGYFGKITSNVTNMQKVNNRYITQNSLANLTISETVQSSDIVDKYKGQDVIGMLEIPKINLNTYILSKCTDKTLGISVTKFWGAEPNEIGNLCIAGHNYNANNMFYNLRKLKVGDILTITDIKSQKVEYKVYHMLKVNPDDVTCLSQETGEKKELTLITCTLDSKLRLIVKAREIE